MARLKVGDTTLEIPPFATPAPTIHTEGQTELMPNYAGQGVATIRDILPAREIVERMVAEAEAIIGEHLPTLIA